MTKTYVCSICGQEMKGYRDQCPYCKELGDNLVESNYGIDSNEDYFNYEQDIDSE